MAVSSKKSCVMEFCTSRTKTFPTEIEVNDSLLEVRDNKMINEADVIVTSNLKWDANTEHIRKNAFNKIWTLRRLKSLRLNNFTILDNYFKEVRVHLEL